MILPPIDGAEIQVLGGRVRVCHLATGGLGTTLDSVMLAAACPAKPGETLLDMGCGVGSAGFCVLARVPEVRLIGVDIVPAQAEMAQYNATLNECTTQARFLAADIRDYVMGLARPLFDHVICNPPYLEAGTYVPSPNDVRAKAMGHDTPDITLEDWVRAAHRAVKSKGSMTFIHRADALPQMMQALGKKFGDITIMPLWPREGQPAKRIIIRAWKDRRGPAVLTPGLVLHQTNGDYTPAAGAILRHMESFT
ncbi:MAG: methyltransferase [Pseudomonadota bacterium]